MSQPVSNAAINQVYTAKAIQEWIVDQLATQLKLDAKEIDVRQPLDIYGLDSAQAMVLVIKAEKLLRLKLSPMLLWHYPTIEALAKRIAEEPQLLESEMLEL